MTAPIGDAAWRARQRARRRRAVLLQGLLALALLALLGALAHNVALNFEARQIKSGFDFLRDPAGFNIGELLFAGFIGGITNPPPVHRHVFLV